jgi:uncharacterized protein (TIGR02145 family)
MHQLLMSMGLKLFQVVVEANEGNFGYIGEGARWWTSTQFNTELAWSRNVSYDNAKVLRDYKEKTYGMSIRCVKD